jgi:AcrR family transcriptional regulator
LSDAHADPHDRILDAALRLLARGGPDAGSLRRIGEAAGLHNSSLFHHFPSKSAIHDALAERVIAPAAACLAPLAGDGPTRLEQLIEALGDLAEQLAARPEHANFLASALCSGDDGPLHAARGRVEAALLEPVWRWIVRARDAGEIRRVRPRPTTLQLVGLVLLEPAWPPGASGSGAAGLRPAARARRREVEAWVRGALTK